MRRAQRLLIVARDPGAASALVPVAIASQADVVAFPHAAPFFERAGITIRALEDDRDGRIAQQLLEELRPRVLVTGTSLRVERDGQWWAAARECGTPSLAVLDHWSHYAERFTVRQPFDRLPDRVAVMDERAADALRQLGFPAERLVVTGQPALDAVLEARPRGRAAARAQWGVTTETRVVLFASEPIAGDLGGASPYDQTDALDVLVRAMAGMEVDTTIVVRHHPREGRDLIAKRFPELRIDSVPSARAAMAGADTVVGITSIFLLEAALAGIPVLSVQPVAAPQPVPGERWELIALARTSEEARAWLDDPAHRAPLSENARRKRNSASGFHPGATERVLEQAGRLRPP